jgi:hypothetical protein
MGASRSDPLVAFLVAVLFVQFSGCQSVRVSRENYAPTSALAINPSTPYLKVHMLNGDVYVLTGWTIDRESKEVRGTGKRFDFNRTLTKTDTFEIPIQGVALFETNSIATSGPIVAMTIVTGASLALTVFCISNPKACFGSCPTFYVWDGKQMRVQAEGFSSSVIPAFESEDIDALYSAKPPNRKLEVILTNEAMETHVIRYAHLLLARHGENDRVFVTPSNEFYEADMISRPSSAIAPEGDCLEKLSAVDGIERFSLADSSDLLTKEEIELTFDSAPGGELGLVLGYRQTLLTTFLFYQALAYMGNSAGQWMAQMQSAGSDYAAKIKSLFLGPVGTIEIFRQDGEGNWEKAGEMSETGPIATNLELLPISHEASSTVRLKLRMTRGLWRLDYAALAHLKKKVKPERLLPEGVVRGDTAVDEEAKKNLAGLAGPLVTLPGDRYSIIYEMPVDYQAYDLFIDTRGYYLEWIRKEWIAEENPNMTFMMFSDPVKYLRVLAPQFKKVEAQMEQAFWRSKYVQHQ